MNLPPTGHGVYARGQSVEWLAQFDFVCLNADRNDATAKAIALRNRGVNVWFYRMPSSWMPDKDFTAEVARGEALVKATGAMGCVVDVENGWRTAHNRSVRAVALSDAIKASIRRGFRWGVTSFPEGLAWTKLMAASGAWFTPQLYDANGDPGWYKRWTSAFGSTRVIPSIGLWAERYPTPGDYHKYLAPLPFAAGAIGWTTAETHDWMLAAFKAWKLSAG